MLINPGRFTGAEAPRGVFPPSSEETGFPNLPGSFYDRYRGLYQLNASQLRQQGGLEKDQTPLDKLSAYDLNLNSLANQMALMAGSSAKVLEAANNLRQVHQQVVGTELTPTWEERLLRPNQARAIAYSSEYQSELPLSNV